MTDVGCGRARQTLARTVFIAVRKFASESLLEKSDSSGSSVTRALTRFPSAWVLAFAAREKTAMKEASAPAAAAKAKAKREAAAPAAAAKTAAKKEKSLAVAAAKAAAKKERAEEMKRLKEEHLVRE